MSEFEDDIDDQLLELAGASEKKQRRKRPKTSPSSGQSKKRKAEPLDTDSEKDVESEEGSEVVDPYPYEGQYIDAADKQRLVALPEIKREEILAERIEQKQRLQEKQVLAQMVKQQRGSVDSENVSKAAKRQHTARGATKEKTRKLDELKAKRRAKDESKRRAKLSPKTNRDRSSSPQDMDISSDESEDGQISKLEQEEERERRLLGGSLTSSNSKSKDDDDDDLTPATIEDFNRCRLTRDLVAKWCMVPWFQDYITGTWVRYLIGNENGEPIYRMCEITNLAADLVKPYKVNDRMVNQAVELKHGKSVKTFNMDRMSNGEFNSKEYERLVKVCKAEDVKLPTKKSLELKHAQMRKLQTQPMTESDVSAMLLRKKGLQTNKPVGHSALERSRLNQARTLAFKRHDYKEVEELDKQIADFQLLADANPQRKHVDERDDVLRKVNERNRKANLDAVRKAELADSERKRKEREGALGPNAVPIKLDPSARLKTMPRLFNAATPVSRPSTPAVPNGAVPTSTAKSNSTTNSSTIPILHKPVPFENSTQAFEKRLLESIEIDLGDF